MAPSFAKLFPPQADPLCVACTTEERAAVQVQNMENAVSIGATKNLVDAFQRFRQSTSNADLEGTALSGGATSSHSVEMEEKTNPATTKNKEWQVAV